MIYIKELYLELFSSPYYSFIEELSGTSFERKKLLGSFYTDYRVADELVNRMISAAQSSLIYSSEISIIDPFCGDGRLVVKFLNKLNSITNLEGRKINITLWDIDEEALESSRSKVSYIKQELKFNGEIRIEKTDTFISYIDEIGNYDFCITNPPWGLLKPLKIINRRVDGDIIDNYKEVLAAYDEYFRREFHYSHPTNRYGKWGTNLGRVGVEVATRLVSKNGICGFVSPSSLFNDQISKPFRELLFESKNIHSISYYQAKLKLYGNADVSSVTVVVKKGTTKSFKINTYGTDFNKVKFWVSEDKFEILKENDFRLPLEGGIEFLHFESIFSNFKTVKEVCSDNNLFFIRELDETRIAEKLVEKGKFCFAKGYMVNRYTFDDGSMYIDETKIKVPISADKHKLVWRDVSRSSQKRRVKATILEPYYIAGNSLGVIYSADTDASKLKILLAIFNSMIFEFQARGKLVSNHVSAGVIKTLKIPNLDNYALVDLVNKRLINESSDLLIEVLVAKMYGLNKSDFFSIVSSFDYSESEVEILETFWENNKR